MRQLKKTLAVIMAVLLCQIPVSAQQVNGTNGIISLDEINMNVGKETTITPEIAEGLTYTYVSGNEEVVTVDSSGHLTAIAEGTAQVTANAYFEDTLVAAESTTVNVVLPTEATSSPTATPTDTPITEDYTVFTFSADSIQVSEGAYSGYEISGTSLKIKKEGKYCVQGTCSDGSITVTKSTTGVELVMNSLNLMSNSTAPVTFNKNTEVVLDIRGDNNIEDTVYNNDETYPDNSLAENAVLKAKEGGTLTITGSGSLTVKGNGKNGIKSNAELIISGPTIEIESADDGISNESSVTINNGTLQITAGGDGIKSSADDEAVGTVTVNGGNVVIDSTGDGIQATQLVDINGGTFDITTYDGADAVYNGDDDSYPSAKGIKAGGSYEVTDDSGNVTEVDAVDCLIDISGGTFILDCADDALHSDKDLTLTGGNYTIATGDDGIHADYVNTIGTQGGSDDDIIILISQSMEAIEGATVNLYSGSVTAYAEDDGVNAANSDLKNYTYSINVTGGDHYISCYAGDGFDSNKDLTFTGGTTVVCGNAGLGEGNPLDCDGTLSITNATVLAIGTGNMAATPGTGIYVVYGSSGTGGRPSSGGSTGSSSVAVTDGNIVAISDSSNNTLFSATAKWSKTNSSCKATYILFASPDLSKGSTYNLNVNGSKITSATASGTQTAKNMEFVQNSSYVIKDEAGNSVDSVAMEIFYTYKTEDETIAAVEADTLKALAAGSTKLTVSAWIGTTLLDSVTAAVTVDSAIMGDVDQDGSVTLSDAQLVLKAALNIISIDDIQKLAADVDGNGEITLADAQMVLKKALGIIE